MGGQCSRPSAVAPIEAKRTTIKASAPASASQPSDIRTDGGGGGGGSSSEHLDHQRRGSGGSHTVPGDVASSPKTASTRSPKVAKKDAHTPAQAWENTGSGGDKDATHTGGEPVRALKRQSTADSVRLDASLKKLRKLSLEDIPPNEGGEEVCGPTMEETAAATGDDKQKPTASRAKTLTALPRKQNAHSIPDTNQTQNTDGTLPELTAAKTVSPAPPDRKRFSDTSSKRRSSMPEIYAFAAGDTQAPDKRSSGELSDAGAPTRTNRRSNETSPSQDSRVHSKATRTSLGANTDASSDAVSVRSEDDTAEGQLGLGLRGAGHVLVAELSGPTRKLLQRWLSEAGYIVTLCENGEAAKICVAQSAKSGLAVDILLCDASLKDNAGVMLWAWVLSNPSSKHIHVLLMASERAPVQVEEAWISQGAKDYVLKPLTKSLLLQKVALQMEQMRDKATIAIKEQQIKRLRSTSLKTIKESVVEAPVQILSKELRSLLQHKDFSSDAMRAKLEELLAMVGQGDLYKPKFLNEGGVASNGVPLLMLGHNNGLHSPGAHNTDDNTDAAEPQTPRRHYSFAMSPLSPHSVSRSLSPIPNVDHTVVEKLTHWDFNNFDYDETTLAALFPAMLCHHNLVKNFGISMDKLQAFTSEVMSHYYDNPYHNFRHAFDVAQTMFALMTSMNAASYLTNTEILGALVAGLCHDIEHPGVNNRFLVMTDSDLAFEYNDQAVLENHHCHVTFQLLRKSDVDIFAHLTPQQRRELRSLIIECILATDMQQHFDFNAKFNQRLSGSPMTRENTKDRRFVLQLLIKSSDISNVAKSKEVCDQWASRISSEFFNQGDEERKRGLEPEVLMDRNKSNSAKNTAGFIEFVVKPLYMSLVAFLPAASIALDHLNSNQIRMKNKALELDIEQARSSSTTVASGDGQDASSATQPVTDIRSRRHARESISSVLSKRSSGEDQLKDRLRVIQHEDDGSTLIEA